MSRRLVDAADGVMTTVEHDDLSNKTTLATFQSPQSINAIIDNNKKMANAGGHKSPEIGLKPKASIPVGLAMQWVQEAGLTQREFWSWPPKEQRKFLARRFMDSDYKYVRTS